MTPDLFVFVLISELARLRLNREEVIDGVLADESGLSSKSCCTPRNGSNQGGEPGRSVSLCISIRSRYTDLHLAGDSTQARYVSAFKCMQGLKGLSQTPGQWLATETSP